MSLCYDRFVAATLPLTTSKLHVLDVGGLDINGSYKSIFSDPRFDYTVVDIEHGDNVDVVLDTPYHIPFPDSFFDIIVCGQMFEHCEYFWLSFSEMIRVLKPTGFLFLIAPSSGPEHRYPVDCYRFFPDSYRALAAITHSTLLDVWVDDRSEWNDCVGIFKKSTQPFTNSSTTRLYFSPALHPQRLLKRLLRFLKLFSAPLSTYYYSIAKINFMITLITLISILLRPFPKVHGGAKAVLTKARVTYSLMRNESTSKGNQIHSPIAETRRYEMEDFTTVLLRQYVTLQVENDRLNSMLGSVKKEAQGTRERERETTTNTFLLERWQDRTFTTTIPATLLSTIQQGTLKSRYRGIPFQKNPFDIGLYVQLFSRMRPSTVIEIGTYMGASALWFADMMQAHGNPNPLVITLDIEPRVSYEDSRIRVMKGDVSQLNTLLSHEDLLSLPKPWLVIEDSSHFYETTKFVLEYFDNLLRKGDYFVVEDGIVSSLGEASMYHGGPNKAVKEFLESRPGKYQVDTEICDWYGYNVTYNLNAWLRRV